MTCYCEVRKSKSAGKVNSERLAAMGYIRVGMGYIRVGIGYIRIIKKARITRYIILTVKTLLLK